MEKTRECMHKEERNEEEKRKTERKNRCVTDKKEIELKEEAEEEDEEKTKRRETKEGTAPLPFTVGWPSLSSE